MKQVDSSYIRRVQRRSALLADVAAAVGDPVHTRQQTIFDLSAAERCDTWKVQKAPKFFAWTRRRASGAVFLSDLAERLRLICCGWKVPNATQAIHERRSGMDVSAGHDRRAALALARFSRLRSASRPGGYGSVGALIRSKIARHWMHQHPY